MPTTRQLQQFAFILGARWVFNEMTGQTKPFPAFDEKSQPVVNGVTAYQAALQQYPDEVPSTATPQRPSNP